MNTQIRVREEMAGVRLYSGLAAFLIFSLVNAVVVLAQDMPANGVPVTEHHQIYGSATGWNPDSLKKNDNDYWVITCKQTLGWGRIEYQADFATEEFLSEIRFDVDLVGWDGLQKYEVYLQYDDGTWSVVRIVDAGAQSITSGLLTGMTIKKVRRLKIKQGQFGWFQMKVDYIYGVKK